MYESQIEHISEKLSFIVASPAAHRLLTHAEVLSQTDVPVLITGEAGSGKATVAQLIHTHSPRSSFEFFTVDCGAVTPGSLENDLFGCEDVGAIGHIESSFGKFEQCAQGTVLLEDFDLMSLALQQRLLNLLETRRFVRVGGRASIRPNVRILASSGIDLKSAVAEGVVDQELYNRLSVFKLHVPPLRDRFDEIPLLLENFVNRWTRQYGLPVRKFSSPLLHACHNYAWPGNLTELENFVNRILVHGDERAAIDELQLHRVLEMTIRSGNLDFEPARVDTRATEETPSLKLLVRNAKEEAERSAIAHALEQTNWNRKATARLLNISYRGLLYKIQEHHLLPPAKPVRPDSFASKEAKVATAFGSGTTGRNHS